MNRIRSESPVAAPPTFSGPTEDESVVNGVRIDPLSSQELLDALDGMLETHRCHVVHFLATHPVALARRDSVYRRTLNGGDLNLPDGMGVIVGLRLQGRRARRVVGPDAMMLISDWGVDRGLRHFLYGGTPEVATRLEDALRYACPGIQVAGKLSPHFGVIAPTELDEHAQAMRNSGADLVWVGLGTPKQDIVAERLRDLHPAAIILCVGAAFDFISGVKPRAPSWLRRLGLEWLYRLATEPRRLWRRYVLENARFVAGLARDLLERPRAAPHVADRHDRAE